MHIGNWFVCPGGAAAWLATTAVTCLPCHAELSNGKSAVSTPPAVPLPAFPQLVDTSPSARTTVLTPIQGPLTLDGKYLGDLSGAVDVNGGGVVDAVRLLDLLKPLLEPGLYGRVRARIAGQERVDMADLSTVGVTLSFDPLSLAFVLGLGASGRSKNDISFRRQEVPDPATFTQPATLSAGINATLVQRYDHDAGRLGPREGAFDLIANAGGFGGVTLTAGADWDGNSGSGGSTFRRREARLTKDLFGPAVRLTAGEYTPLIQGFQGAQRLLGFSAARAYSTIRPFQNIRPSGRRQFILDRESFVEVEVNGIIVERLRLTPGPYSLSDFPFGQGASAVRLLIDDEVGRHEIAVFDVFGGDELLDPGVVDFGVSGGVLETGRLTYGSSPGISGYLRKGISDRLSLGINAQATGRRGQIGGSATFGSVLGLIAVEAAASKDTRRNTSGLALSLDYRRDFSVWALNDFRLLANVERISRNFSDAFTPRPSNDESLRAAAQITGNVRNFNLTLGGALIRGRDTAPDRRSYSFSIGRNVGRFGVSVSLGREETRLGRTNNRFGLALTTNFGRRLTATARYDSTSGLRELGISRPSTGELNDISGSINVSEDGGRRTISGQARYLNNLFESELTYNRLFAKRVGGATSQDSLFRVSTFVGYADGKVAMGRPVRDAFLIASVDPTLRGSKVALTDIGGRVIARAGPLRTALVPIPRAYGVSRFELAVDPLPTGYDLGTGLAEVFPGYGSGYRYNVGSAASHTVLGILMGPAGPLALISGTVEPVEPDTRKAAHVRPFFTNRSGRFVADGMAPGRYRILVGGKTIGTIAIPPKTSGIIDAGTIAVSSQDMP